MESEHYEFIDLAYLNQVAGEDENTRSTLLDLVSKELLEVIPLLSDLYASKKWGAIKDHVHRMKTTMAFTGNADLMAANNQIWKILVLMESPESIAPMIHVLDSKYRQVAEALQTELRRMKGD